MYIPTPIEETLISDLSENGIQLIEWQSLFSVPFTGGANVVLELLNNISLPNNYSRQITIHTLNSEKVKLKFPIIISMCYQEGQFYTELFELNVRGIGIDEYKAISDFKLNLLDLFYTLKELPKDKLGPEPLRWKQFFDQYLDEDK